MNRLNILRMWLLLALLASCGVQQQSGGDNPRRPASQKTGSVSRPDNGVPGGSPANAQIDRFTYDLSVLRSANRKMDGVYYDYNYAYQNVRDNSVTMRFSAVNDLLKKTGGNLGVVLLGTPMSDSGKEMALSTAVSVDAGQNWTVTAEGLSPGVPYRFKAHFFDKAQKDQASGAPVYLGSASKSYLFATANLSDSLSMARSRIVARGVGEEQDWALNRYDRSKGYTKNPGYGWCHIFYNWVIKNDLKTHSGSENTHYNSAYWKSTGGLVSGADELSLAGKEAIHGDYFRVGSHAAMIIAYDKAKGELFTLEGNFNNRVEFYRRRAPEFSWVGHITAPMVTTPAMN